MDVVKKLYYTVSPNFHCREINVYEIIDNEPKEFCVTFGETFDDTEAYDRRNIAEALLEDKGLTDSDYELIALIQYI